MLCRLNTAHDEIIEVLLSQRQVTPALRYARSVGLAESVSARKFLEAAMGSGSDQVFYSTFIFFSLRNTRLRGNPAFAKGGSLGHCSLILHVFLLFLLLVVLLLSSLLQCFFSCVLFFLLYFVFFHCVPFYCVVLLFNFFLFFLYCFPCASFFSCFFFSCSFLFCSLCSCYLCY
ncbi:uncharacterized protein E2C01_082396 [Portunus trituberculatus]|uniref:Mic1 domain-containing protein n=1 Tax=Portunus trituberculatus TaxID=210409 RepID=A0A5B7IPU2_PORTR|nr:uncharacterized protein [Portunus trituberculatus]